MKVPQCRESTHLTLRKSNKSEITRGYVQASAFQGPVLAAPRGYKTSRAYRMRHRGVRLGAEAGNEAVEAVTWRKLMTGVLVIGVDEACQFLVRSMTSRIVASKRCSPSYTMTLPFLTKTEYFNHTKSHNDSVHIDIKRHPPNAHPGHPTTFFSSAS
ncbi:hypothetical protein K491DRAFT_684063 [Lophiostoma macrostomum CBS 122681]|uniref:Uncharacterized protein n=1 Tax=Lophiostoma macrostomum CBS 122681 TaxID=1314788 RepID=A0A6A6SNA8_9PLEO|nr:hypothetical protein K491DRAFT_684063 [Lophiostoma macrostomum CBS 122681]